MPIPHEVFGRQTLYQHMVKPELVKCEAGVASSGKGTSRISIEGLCGLRRVSNSETVLVYRAVLWRREVEPWQSGVVNVC